MLMRMTMVIDKEITEQQAMEQYGTNSPYAVARSIQAEADSKIAPEARVKMGAEHVSIQVVPIG